MIWYDSPSTTILFPWILDARIYSTLKSRTPNKVSRVFFLRQFVLLVKIRRVIPAKQNKGFRVLSFVDQATPRFELGKKDLQSPTLPLGHAAKTLQNRWKYSPFACFVWGVTKCLFFYCTSIWNLVFLNSLPKRNPSFFWSGSIPSIDFIVSQNTQYLNPSLFYWKTKYGFSVTKEKFRTNWNH